MAKNTHKGRGSTSNPACRYQVLDHFPFDDGWGNLDEPVPKLKTTVTIDQSRSILTRNESPDVPFEQSINVYRGCEHGCSYCFARPTHAYLGFSPGMDFESRLLVKPEAAVLLRKELSRKNYRCSTIAMGTNTDPYQPIERKWRVTRAVLEVLLECQHPVSLVTKSSLIERDVDILTALAELNLIVVLISVTTLDCVLARRMEPRAATPERRLKTIELLSAKGIPTGVLVAPVIPALNDSEMEDILRSVVAAGARYSDYVLLRLPLEVETIFRDWLYTHYPLKAERVLSAIRDTRAGEIYDAQFGQRMRGQGPYAEMLAQRFRLKCKRLGIDGRDAVLDTHHFKPPVQGPYQASLF